MRFSLPPGDPLGAMLAYYAGFNLQMMKYCRKNAKEAFFCEKR